MSWDEAVRLTCYALLFPGFAYLSMVAKNQRQRLKAAIYVCLAIFFLLLLVGLALLRFAKPIPTLLHINTFVAVTMTVLVARKVTGYLQAYYLSRQIEV